MPNFVLLFYIYFHYAISFWDFKTHRDGHNHGGRHRSQKNFVFKNWSKFGKLFFLIYLKKNGKAYIVVDWFLIFVQCCSISCIFFYNFWKFKSDFLKNYTTIYTAKCHYIYGIRFLGGQFCTPSWHLCGCGKLRNHQKITPGGLCRWAKKCFLKPGFWQFSIFTKCSCCNLPKLP